MMTKKLINVQISSVDQLATIICEIDEQQAGPLSREVIKSLVEKAHETIITMLGPLANEIYGDSETELRIELTGATHDY